MSEVNDLLEKAIQETAIQETDKLINGEVFLVKDLFKGYEWNRIPRNNRLLRGTLFLNYINSKKSNIMAIEKTTSGQQKYCIR